MQSSTASLYGYDGYFHVRYAEVLRTEGVSRTFPWWQETFLRDRYADKDFLYHLLLIPFTFGDLIAGGRAAAVVFGAAAMGIFFAAVARLGAPWPVIWPFVLLSSSTAFLYRLGFTRPLVLAVALAVAGTAAILLGRKKWAFALAALYPHLHISYHLLPCVAALHDLHEGKGGTWRERFAMTRWTLGGAVIGALLSPYVPNNLYLWWVQNVKVLSLAWAGPAEMGLGNEIRPGGSDQLLKYNIGVFLVLAMAGYLLARARRRASPAALTLLVISGGFLGLSMLSRRFVEFWAPFTVLLAAVAARDFLAGRAFEGERAEWRAGLRKALPAAGAAAAALTMAALLFVGATKARSIISEDDGLKYADAGAWMAANVPAGETIFHLDWDDFPQLFFLDPQFRYLVGLDPTFMYVTDPHRWKLWRDVTHADVTEIFDPIRSTFGCRWVFAIPEAEGFKELASRDPRFRRRYQDDHATVYFLADGFRFATSWRLTGWYPNAARRLDEVPLGPEPGDRRDVAAPDPIGPAAEGMERGAGDAFVDLARDLALPITAPPACGVAETTLVAAEEGPATLYIATDDEYRLYVGGELLADSSTLLRPPPGQPGGPPVDLDSIGGSLPEGIETAYVTSLRAGENPVLIKTCKVGRDFGFYFRAETDRGVEVPSRAPGEADSP